MQMQSPCCCSARPTSPRHTFTHGWDLAKATGQSTDLDPALAEQILEVAAMIVPDQFRGPEPMPFGPAVEPPAGAPVADRLAAFFGRTP